MNNRHLLTHIHIHGLISHAIPYGLDLNVTKLLAYLLTKPYVSPMIVFCNLVSIKNIIIIIIL